MAIVILFNDTPTTEFFTLSLHDALPIWCRRADSHRRRPPRPRRHRGQIPAVVRQREVPRHHRAAAAHAHGRPAAVDTPGLRRSEEHTSELQSLAYLVCRLLLEKKKK